MEDPSPTDTGRSDDVLESLLRLLALDRLPRTGWIQAGVPVPETVAAHSLGTCLVVLALAPRVVPALDVDRAVALAAVHDAPEAELSDLPRSATELLPPGAKAVAEARAAEALLGPLSPIALDRHAEYAAQETREARFARLCDKLQMGVRALGYALAGQRSLASFRASISGIDCSEFAPCAELQGRILERLDALLRR